MFPLLTFFLKFETCYKVNPHQTQRINKESTTEQQQKNMTTETTFQDIYDALDGDEPQSPLCDALQKQFQEFNQTTEDNKKLVELVVKTVKEKEELKEGHSLIYQSLRKAEGVKELMTGPEFECIAESVEVYTQGFHEKEDKIEELKEEMLELYDEEGARENCEVLGLVPEDEYNAMKLMYENSQYQLESLETDKRIKDLKEERIAARCEEKMTEHVDANKKFKEELRELGMKVCS